MFIFMIFNFIYNFRDYGIKNIDNKATVLAKTIEHTLTSQMQTGVIDKRDIFLEQLEDLPTINKIWLSRGHKVIEMYGEGNNEHARDYIDKEVLKTGVAVRKIDERMFTNSTYRITIPYKASSKGAINCMACHTNAKEGDTLGAITITIPIDDSKQMGINTIVHTSFIALVLIIIIAFLINYLVSPFLSLFDSIRRVMKHAQEGDYSYRVEEVNSKDAKDVANWINTLLVKLENTLGEIDSKISIFLSNKKVEEKDPLINVKNTVDKLVCIYKFTKTIEQDENLEDIYSRIASILKTELKTQNFNIFEVDTRTAKLTNVYAQLEDHCDYLLNGCRANSTNEIVDSTQFTHICNSCKEKDTSYLCIPYSISNELDLVISIKTTSEKENIELRKNISIITDYIDAAKTIIMSKKLMKKLELSARTDSLTKLYNRKYLEDQLPKIKAQSNRTGISYGILMLDIDHFKKINDTYGHDIGDEALKVISQTLVENTRKSDIVVRYGGEEFIILLHNCNYKHISSIAEKIRLAFKEKEIPIGNNDYINKTISIGAAMFPENNEELETCIKHADMALYEAKNSGRDKVVTYKQSSQKTQS